MNKIDITVWPEREEKKQGDLFGIFFEDLNHAADGGLYGELVQNRSFEFDAVDREGYHALTAWKTAVRGNSMVKAHVETDRPLHPDNPHYLVLEVLADQEGGGIANEGFAGGISVKREETYIFSCFGRSSGNKPIPLEVCLEDVDGKYCYGRQRFVMEGRDWRKYKCTFTAEESCRNARLVILVKESARVELDMVSLFPLHTFQNRENGMRSDIAQMLVDMKPRFMRFPGGCLIHVGSLKATDRCSVYRWKSTIRPIEERPSRRNTWNYNQTLGMGFYEFFIFCEDIGTEPLPVICAGYDPHHLQSAPLDGMKEWIDEALDLIEFANGDTDTTWGAKRAQMGHPDPFGLKYLGIGNEEVGEDFFIRYEIIAHEVQKRYPEIKLINSAGPGSAGSEFVKGWEQACRTHAAFVDEHFYQCPEWFIANENRYQDYAAEPKAFLGEYASLDDTWKNALAEAAFMTGMEKAKGAGLACYAPMLCNVNYQNWTPNMICFDQDRVYGTPSYYVQKLFMNNQGEVLVRAQDTIPEKRKKVPVLSGGIGMRTQKACVEISGFQITDHESGKIWTVPDFTLSEIEPWRECLKTDADSYTISFHFKKRNGGRAGNLDGLFSFDLEFARKDDANKICWRIDGWQRLTSLNGFVNQKSCDMGLYLFESEVNREYEAELVVNENQIHTYINGELYCEHCCRDPLPEVLYYSTVKESDGTIVVKLVNAEAEEKETDIIIAGEEGDREVEILAMEGFSPTDRNSFENPAKVSPTERKGCMKNGRYTCHLLGNSLYVLRFAQKEGRASYGA